MGSERTKRGRDAGISDSFRAGDSKNKKGCLCLVGGGLFRLNRNSVCPRLMKIKKRKVFLFLAPHCAVCVPVIHLGSFQLFFFPCFGCSCKSTL